ncbi:hypothetical protein MNBD_GAMMA01-804 [hydrothermal vent metagenome]|uniref:Uncharacterized protein n=1 Tax=hydrothermal vent metagenome TaxID=652676 RepID=A0A3B0VWA6_9ZZZZ
MAKCPICNSRKGKRKCLLADSIVCSLCCGNTRTEEACSECGFYQKPKRKYNEIEAYSVSEMDGNMELESYGNSIEGSLCAYDEENENKLSDHDAIRIIESLIDIYHFKDQCTNDESPLISYGVKRLEISINEDLNDVSNEVLVKILGVIRFVAKRRTKTGREYMNIIHQYVGQRIASGVRVMRP